jgi:hypothetical protein
MTGTSRIDTTTIAPLVEEVHAAEAAWRDGGTPPLTALDRMVLRAASRLLRRSRHSREHPGRAADARGVDRTFEHRVDAGALR